MSEHASACDSTFTLKCGRNNWVDFWGMDGDEDGNLLFPIHDACIEVIQQVISYKNTTSIEASVPEMTLKTFYDLLCKQYEKPTPSGRGWHNSNFGMYGLEWDHGYYGAHDFRCFHCWEGDYQDRVSKMMSLKLVTNELIATFSHGSY